MATSMHIFANGDPVMKYSSITRVANPEPLTISEIEIEREELRITHIDGYNCFEVTYTFKNVSYKDFPEIHYGFPIDYYTQTEDDLFQITDNDDISESLKYSGWSNALIKDVKFTFNNQELPYHCAKESVRAAGYVVETYDSISYDSITVEAIDRRWFYTQFSIKPYEKAILKVQYKVYANSSSGLFADQSYFKRYKLTENIDDSDKYIINMPFITRYFIPNFDILYDFSPAKHFGKNNSYYTNIIIDLSNLNNPNVYFDNYKFYTQRIEKWIYGPTSSCKPIDLSVNYTPDLSYQNINRIINKFEIPKSDYKLRTIRDSLIIDFQEPRFVSELACDIDSTLINSFESIVIYSDGKKEYYKYEPNKAYYHELDIINSPMFITITDSYHNGTTLEPPSNDEYVYKLIRENFNDEKFKIKTIKLLLNDKSKKAKDVFKNLKVLDSRFK